MKRHVFISTLIFLMVSCGEAYAKDKGGLIYGFVHDRLTHENLFGTKVSLMKNDSIIATWVTNSQNDVDGHVGPFFFETDLRGGNYVLIFEKEGYNILSWPLVNPKPVKSGEHRFIAVVPLDKKPKDRTLDGVTIKATKVKFYNKGDTVVYDADAFQTAEGSMLDALIKQLPGVELHDDGQIFVNGKKVDYLLLNGEKFFDKNNQIMLENMPAYLVKNVQTYDKRSPGSKLMGKDVEESDLVMDVNLKKQYQIGWIANAEIGEGTQDRYLARLFALRFTDNSRVSLYGNLNNLNDTRKPGEQSSWTPETMPSAMIATKKGGADFLLKSKDGFIKYNANIEINKTDLDAQIKNEQEFFLPNGNTFNLSRQLSRNENFRLYTKHEIEIWSPKRGATLNIYPSLTYNKYNNKYNSLGFTFNQNPKIKDMAALIDSVNNDIDNDNTLRAMLINQSQNNSKTDGHSLNTLLFALYSQKVGTVNTLQFGVDFNYTTQTDNVFRQQYINYTNGNNREGVKINRYTRNNPDKSFYSRTFLSFKQRVNKNLTIQLNYLTKYTYSERNHHTYLLNRLEGWDDLHQNKIGTLPSETQLLTTIDNQNTYYRTLGSFVHSPTVRITYNKQTFEQNESKLYSKVNTIRCYLVLPLNFVHDRMDYQRYTYDRITKRNNVFFDPNIIIDIKTNNYQDNFQLTYTLNHSAPPMVYSANILNNEDPLNLYYGNENLKNIVSHSSEFNYNHINRKKEIQSFVSIKYNILCNSVAYGYVYDKTTGVRTYRPENFNGNYTLSGAYEFSRPLDKKHRITFENNLSSQIIHGVDLISTDIDILPQRSSVKTYWTKDKLKLVYRINKNLRIGIKSYIGYGHSASSRKGFNNVNVCDFHYGITSLLTLPYQWQVSTDLTMYSRRGYSTSSANTNDLVWNARLSKTFTKAGITLAIDGFDILGNLSNYSQVLNSQGRTETWRNSLPRYVMAHVIYRFNKQPKKR